MSGGYRIHSGTASRITQHHDAAAESIDGSAEGLPAEIDGGAATPYLAEIMGVVAGGLGSLSDANRGMAEIVRQTGEDFYETESDAAESFTSLGSALDDAS